MPNRVEVEKTNTINIGISDQDRKSVCHELNKLFSKSYVLYLKTQNYHWNVTGHMFQSLYLLFEEQYKELARATDLIAQRIRSLGEFAPGPFAAFSKFETIHQENSVPSAEEMIQNLIQGNETVVTTAREIVSLANECDDDVTTDLMIERMQIHEKNAWMLRSMIGPQA